MSLNRGGARMEPTTFAIATGMAVMALWESGKYGWQSVRIQSPLKRFYRFRKSQKVIIVQSAVANLDNREFYEYLAAPESMESYRLIWSHLREIGHPTHNVALRFAPDVIGEDLSCD